MPFCLTSDKLAVRSVNIVIVRITSWLVLSFRDNARNTIYENVLQYLFRLVQTLSLLARHIVAARRISQQDG